MTCPLGCGLLHSPDDPSPAHDPAWLEAERVRLTTALEFYADPDSYFAIAVIADRPAGAFADDFSLTEDCIGDVRERPGKHAREALRWLTPPHERNER